MLLLCTQIRYLLTEISIIDAIDLLYVFAMGCKDQGELYSNAGSTILYATAVHRLQGLH